MLVLGDNPFFGVNHASVAKSQGYFSALRSLDWAAAHATMRAALASNVSSFMVSTHAEAPDLLRSMSVDPDLRRFAIIPAVPYLHRLNGLVASKGVPAALMQSIAYPDFVMSVLGGAKLTAAGLHAFIRKEVEPIRRLGFETPAIALQNIFVDLLIGLGAADVINEVAQRMKSSRLIAITMNPLLADRLLDPSIVICTHYNYLGYLVQPDLGSVREWATSTKRAIWAMGVLSSGRAKLDRVCTDPVLHRFDAVVVGASRPTSIESFAATYAANH